MKLIDGLLFAALAIPVAAQTQVTASPVIESIEFEGLTGAQQKLVNGSLTVRQGDSLSADARQRVARDLQTLGLNLTFSYKPGTKYGSAKLKISSGC